MKYGRLAWCAFALTACEPDQLTWTQNDGYRSAPLSVSSRGNPGFTVLDGSDTGIRYQNDVPESLIIENQHVLNGSGVAVGDVNGDGWVDVFFPKLDGPNQLYLNEGGFTFRDVTDSAGVGMADDLSTGAVFADVDNDRDLDLLVTTLGPNRLFQNDGTGRFTEAVFDTTRLGSTTMTLADVDGDGDLDVYVANYKVHTVRDVLSPEERAFDNVVEERADGTFHVRPEFADFYDLEVQRDRVMRLERGDPDRLFINDGNGNFAAVADFQSRFSFGDERRPSVHDWGLAARFYDVDQDGDPDLYVCNDFESPDRFWINDGTGHFTPAAPLAQRKSSQSSMAVDFADVDRDGDVDFFVADMLSRDSVHRRTQNPLPAPEQRVVGRFDDRPQEQRNTLFISRGDGTFAEVARAAGVAASGWSWASQFLDVDLDGYEDLIIGTGYGNDAMDSDTQQRISRGGLRDWRREVLSFPPLPQRNIAFRNRGDGTFDEVGAEWGVDTRDITHGVAAADFDLDGDQDLVLNRQDGETLVLRNNASGNRIQVRLVGTTSNRFGVGAVVSVEPADLPGQSREITSGGLYLSHSDHALTFATGDADSVTVTVRWPAGTSTTIRAAANHTYEIEETVSSAVPAPPAANEPPAFVDVSEQLGATHHDVLFEDVLRQPLIPFAVSQLGPGLTWTDVDGDGWVDLIVPSGVGGQLRWYRNQNGRFTSRALGPVAELDQGGALPLGPGQLLVSVINHEAARPSVADAASPVQLADPGAGTMAPLLGGSRPSAGPMALADVEGDGDLDLFVGRRSVPAAYPMGAPSELYLNDGGEFVLDQASLGIFLAIERASDALFSDLDLDGDPDLVVASDLGAVRVFRNNAGRFSDVTRQMGLERHHGRWNGIATGDLNGDGLPDLVATNWGTNTWYDVTEDFPLRIQHGDIDNNGSYDVLESTGAHSNGWYEPVADFDRFAQAVPSAVRPLSSVRQFAGLSMDELLGGASARLALEEVTTLQHMVFLNQGSTFEGHPLPAAAQLAPGFGVTVADANGDGHADVFVGHNLFGTPPVLGRLDGGRGLWMLGDGSGALRPWEASGVAVWGEQRGVAAADYDRDGRVDLAVAQNGAAVKLFRNTAAPPGVRVRLVGSDENPLAIGARVRRMGRAGPGPTWEVRAGGGYWSMDDAVVILGGLAGTGDSVEVTGPDGTVITRSLDGMTEIEVVLTPR